MFLSRSMDGFRRIHKTAKSNCLSFRTEQLGSQGMSFMKFYILVVSKILFRKNVSLKSKKNSRCCTWSCNYICENISPDYPQNETFSQKKN